MSIGLEARVAHAQAVVLDALQHPASILKFVRAEHLAFIDGALSPAGSPVPMMLVDEDYLAQAFLSGQEKRGSKYGFVLSGRWVYRHEVCKRCQKADYPIVKPHGVCGGCFVDYVREARHHNGAVDKAFRQADLVPGLQVQSQRFEQTPQDAILDPSRELKPRKQFGYDGNRSGKSAQAAPLRNTYNPLPGATRSSTSTGIPRAYAGRLVGKIQVKRTAISDAEAVAIGCRSCVPVARPDM